MSACLPVAGKICLSIVNVGGDHINTNSCLLPAIFVRVVQEVIMALAMRPFQAEILHVHGWLITNKILDTRRHEVSRVTHTKPCAELQSSRSHLEECMGGGCVRDLKMYVLCCIRRIPDTVSDVY